MYVTKYLLGVTPVILPLALALPTVIKFVPLRINLPVTKFRLFVTFIAVPLVAITFPRAGDISRS